MVMRCPEDRKVTVAIFLLQKGVDDWWRLVENRWKEGNKPSQENFKNAFYEKYYP